jgi:hypothetical protein
MRQLKKETGERLKKMSVYSILDERDIGGQKAKLSSKDFNKELNDFQIFEARKRRKNFPCLH